MNEIFISFFPEEVAAFLIYFKFLSGNVINRKYCGNSREIGLCLLVLIHCYSPEKGNIKYRWIFQHIIVEFLAELGGKSRSKIIDIMNVMRRLFISD